MKTFKKLLSVAIAALLGFSILPMRTATFTATAAVTTANTQKHNSNLSISPAVITKMEKSEQLDEYLLASYMPSTLILDIDEQLNVLSSENETISTLDTVYQKFKRKIVLVINVSSEAEGDAFAGYVATKAIEDISVMSSDPTLVSYVKAKQPRIRAVVDYSAKDLGESISDEILETHRVGANVIVLNQTQSTYENVFYTQGMLTTVWTVADEATEFGIASCVSTGAYGIISDDYALCYATYEKYTSGSLPRSFYNIAHRTLPYSHPENSLEGMQAAVEGGATHVEIDIKVTKDGELVIMHDNDISRTTNGSGDIESMTLSEIRQYQLTKTMAGTEMDGVVIPTLAEAFAYLKTHDFILVVEIKTENSNCCTLLKALMDEYQVYDKVVVITYSLNQLARMRTTLPEVPLASLNSFVYVDFANGALGDMAEVNAVPNCAFDYDTHANRNYKSRGYMAYAYTYDNAMTAIGAAVKGCTGITNNRADGVGEYAKRIYAENATVESGVDITAVTIPATLEDYNGTTESVNAKVAFYEETDGGYKVILKYETKDYTLYSEVVEISVQSQSTSVPSDSVTSNVDSQGGAQTSSGCGGTLSVGIVEGVLLMVCVLFVKKNER